MKQLKILGNLLSLSLLALCQDIFDAPNLTIEELNYSSLKELYYLPSWKDALHLKFT